MSTPQGQQITAADVERARAEGHAAGRVEAERENQSALVAARAESITAERARMKGILMHAEADGRRELAMHLACETDMTPDAAGVAMKAAPKAEASAKSPLERAMAQAGSPGIQQQEVVDTGGKVTRLNTEGVYANRQRDVERARGR